MSPDDTGLDLQCDVDGCETSILGLEDGWEFSRGVVCADCIGYQREHGHWPDEDTACQKCLQEATA